MILTKGKREEQTAGLRPAGVQRLRELRRENTDLRLRLEDVEKALEEERSEHKVGAILLEFAPELSEARLPPPAAEKEEASGPGRRGRALPAGPHGIAYLVGNIGFYLAIALLLAGAVLFRSAQAGAPMRVAGYSGMLVLSESMQDAIPKGSFILTRAVEPEELQVGDDITFMVNPTTSVTHRIVDIHLQADGRPIIRTQGVNNPAPDTPVANENIVGKVVYHSLLLGLLAKGVSDNWPLLLFLLVLWGALGKFLAYTITSRNEGRRLKQ